MSTSPDAYQIPQDADESTIIDIVYWYAVDKQERVVRHLDEQGNSWLRMKLSAVNVDFTEAEYDRLTELSDDEHILDPDDQSVVISVSNRHGAPLWRINYLANGEFEWVEPIEASDIEIHTEDVLTAFAVARAVNQ